MAFFCKVVHLTRRRGDEGGASQPAAVRAENDLPQRPMVVRGKLPASEMTDFLGSEALHLTWPRDAGAIASHGSLWKMACLKNVWFALCRTVHLTCLREWRIGHPAVLAEN